MEQFYNVEFLSINSSQLKSLENMPSLPVLKRLELNDNKLSDADLEHLTQYKELQVLKLGGN